MFIILFLITILVISVILFVLIFISYKKDWNVPILGDFIKKQYQKARFKIWDDLSVLDSKKIFSKFRIICLKFHKFEVSFYQFLSILFRSEKDSFVLLNCDQESGKCDKKDFPNHKELKKKVSFFSMIGLAILIIVNILASLIISQIIPNVFDAVK